MEGITLTLNGKVVTNAAEKFVGKEDAMLPLVDIMNNTTEHVQDRIWANYTPVTANILNIALGVSTIAVSLYVYGKWCQAKVHRLQENSDHIFPTSESSQEPPTWEIYINGPKPLEVGIIWRPLGGSPLNQFDIYFYKSYFLTTIIIVIFFIISYFIINQLLYRNNFRNIIEYILYSLVNLIQNMLKDNLRLTKFIFFPNILFLFLFILICNLLGLIPYAFTITSSLIVAFVLATTYFIGSIFINVTTNGTKTSNTFLPSGIPLPITLFLVPIEIISYFARMFSLSIRLFANMMSGHALLKILGTFTLAMLSDTRQFIFTLFPWTMVTIIVGLEIVIAILQAFVFTILNVNYLNDSINSH